MKLEVGMYVRTENGYIRKCVTVDLEDIDSYELDDFIPNEYGDFINWLNEDELNRYILKASHNIIDLIEENDYIRIVTSAYFEPVYYSYGKLVIRDDIDISKYTNKFIAEVITHEQMKSMSYKVGE
jgi:hypothetical protein